MKSTRKWTGCGVGSRNWEIICGRLRARLERRFCDLDVWTGRKRIEQLRYHAPESGSAGIGAGTGAVAAEQLSELCKGGPGTKMTVSGTKDAAKDRNFDSLNHPRAIRPNSESIGSYGVNLKTTPRP